MTDPRLLRQDVDKALSEWSASTDDMASALGRVTIATSVCVVAFFGGIILHKSFGGWYWFAPLGIACAARGYIQHLYDVASKANTLAFERWKTLDRAHSKVFMAWLDETAEDGDEVRE